MEEAQTRQVKVQIDANGMHYESSGNPEEVIPQILQFLSEAVPTYDLAKKLIYVPDLASLADGIAEFAKITTTNQLLLTRNDLPTEKSLSIVLFMAHLAAKFAKRSFDSLNIEELATAVSKAPKTIRNTIVKMQKSGLIERTERGNYRITPKGLMDLENSLNQTPMTQQRTKVTI